MDIVSHVILSTALTDVNPLAILGSILPDLTMFKRKPVPDKYYILLHSPLAAICIGLVCPMLGVGIMSHILLDFFTHGPIFSPRLIYPFSNWRFSKFKEWEFGNDSFYRGIILIIIILIGVML